MAITAVEQVREIQERMRVRFPKAAANLDKALVSEAAAKSYLRWVTGQNRLFEKRVK